MDDCLTLSLLLKYQQGQETSSQHVMVYAHLATGCRICHENQRWLDLVINAAASDRSFDFSEETLAAIITKFKKQYAARQQPIRQYFAELIFERLLTPQFADTRPQSEEVSGRRALYHAAGYDIDLRFVLDKNNGERMIGQVRPDHWDTPDLPTFKVELLQDGSVVSAMNTNGRGRFIFAQLISGTYDLKVSVPEGEINLERVPTARSL
jgi:hypothetical protein